MPKLRGFVGPAYTAQSPVVSVEELINLYPESRDAGTPQANTWLVATACGALRQSIGLGPHRCDFEQDGRAFAVSGAGFYEVFADDTSTLRGPVRAGTDHGSIVSNGQGGFQLLIVVGLYGYTYNLTTNVLTEIADPDFPQGRALKCDFLDGYGIVTIKDSATFMISALEDFTSWDGLDIAQRSQASDNLVTTMVDWDHKVFWLFGSHTTEIWWDSGAAGFPFEPVPNSLIKQGAAATFGITAPKGAVIWVSQNADGGRMAFAGVGAATSRISTHAVETAWAAYAQVADAICFTYDWKGHSFCVFTFPGGNATWVYDLTDQQWHKWQSWDTTTGSFVQHLAVAHMYAFGKHLVGSRFDGSLYELRSDTLTDGGAMVRRMRRAVHVSAEGRWVFCSKLEFKFQVGVGLTTGQGSNPQVMLRISRDGGMTWGDERWATLGAIGAYLTRVLFWKNGRWRDGVIELTITDPVVVALTDCYAEIEAAA